MRYFDENRRKLIRQSFIRGTRATVTEYSNTLAVLDSVGSGLDYLEIRGSALSQIGTPTPQNPIPIQGVSPSGIDITVKGSETVTINIPLSLHGIGNNYDRLIYSKNECYKDVRVIYRSVKEILNMGGSYYGWENNGIRVVTVTWWGYPNVKNSPFYCTHAPIKDTVSGYTGLSISIIGCEIMFYGYTQNTPEEFIAWAIENDVRVAYALDSIEREYLNTVPPINKYTKYKDFIIEASPSSVTKMSATYYSSEKEDKHSLTVHYVDTEGKALLESKVSLIRCNSRYTVIPPKIEGYEPLVDELEGYLIENREITITYKEK